MEHASGFLAQKVLRGKKNVLSLPIKKREEYIVFGIEMEFFFLIDKKKATIYVFCITSAFFVLIFWRSPLNLCV